MKKTSLARAIYDRALNRELIKLVVILLSLIIAEVILTCLIPTWRQYFYNILELKDANQFHTAMIYFMGLMISLGAVAGLKAWVGQLVSFNLRIAATKILFKEPTMAPAKVSTLSP